MVRLLIIFAIAASSAFAIDDTPANREREALRYLQVVPPRDMFEFVAQRMSRDLPPPVQQRFRAAFFRDLDLDAISAAMKESLVRRFSADELRALSDFWGSPIGKTIGKKFQEHTGDTSALVSETLTKAWERARVEIPDAK